MMTVSHTWATSAARPRHLPTKDADQLARAIQHPEAGGLTVAYQPQVDLTSGVILGVEALARWSHPRRGPVPPAEFIPLAERSGLIAPLGRWILRRAIADLAGWERRDVGSAPLRLSVNVASEQITPRLVTDALQACNRTGLEPHRLTLEITETSALDSPRVRPTLTQLRRHGISLALDDFGTGYGTFEHLRELPINVVKLDRSFVIAPHGVACDALVRAMFSLSDDLDIDLIAEGIETPAEHLRLLQFGCQTGQGYLFGRPMNAAALAGLLAEQDTAAVAPGIAAQRGYAS